ncbi:hypothetical protein Droror1_Dr00015869, partial [Drosera rotundifolia]
MTSLVMLRTMLSTLGHVLRYNPTFKPLALAESRDRGNRSNCSRRNESEMHFE